MGDLRSAVHHSMLPPTALARRIAQEFERQVVDAFGDNWDIEDVVAFTIQRIAAINTDGSVGATSFCNYIRKGSDA